MDLYQYVKIVWRRKWIVIFTMVAALSVAVVGTQLIPPAYTATATVRILTIKQGGVDYLQRDIQYAERLMNTYATVAESTAVRDELAQRLERDTLPAIQVEILANTELLQITVEDSDPVLAAETANTLADILVDRSDELYTGDTRLPSEIIGDQLRVVENELLDATVRYESLQVQGDASPQEIELARQTVELKQSQYAALLSQYERTRTTEAVLRNSASIVNSAFVPTTPSKPNLKLNLALGLAGGIAAGLGLAFVFENLDRRLYTTDEIKAAAKLPLAGTIPAARSRRRDRLFGPDSIEHEAFKRMAARLIPPHVDENQLTRIKGIGPVISQKLNAAGIETLVQLATISADNLRGMLDLPEQQAGNIANWIEQARRLAQQQANQTSETPRTFLITSAKPGEGKSTVAANLAAAAAHLRRRVLLVDADLRLPTLHKTFDVDNQVGLTSYLSNKASLDDVIRASRVPGLFLLTSGPPAPDPTELLGSSLMSGLIRQLMQRYDIVVVDSPALLAVTDTAVMTPIFEAVLLVVRRDGAQPHIIQAAREQLESAQTRPISVVVNRAERSRDERYYHYYQRASKLKTQPSAAPARPATDRADERVQPEPTGRKPALRSHHTSTSQT